MRRLSGLFLFAALGAVAGCGGSGEPFVLGPPSVPAEPSGAEIRETLRWVDEAGRDSFLVGRLQRSGVTPFVGTRFTLPSGVVGGFVPGRHPVRGTELVLVAARSGPAAAALLEATRLLVARAAYTASPERTVLVAFLPVSREAEALEAVFAAPLWRQERVVAAVVVEPGVATAARAQALAADRAWPLRFVEAVEGPGQTDTAPADVALALARTAYEAVVNAANGAPAAPDVSPPYEPPPDSLGSED